jgi:hypothetical protein
MYKKYCFRYITSLSKDPDPYHIEMQDLDPYQSEKQDPDLYQYQKGLDPQLFPVSD